ncbi:UDP-N-acetylmuramoyl-L-alanine--D-glutamate ligase [Candidatus Parcubacteria bacterium]|nr:UDP-N-acetylmuramoyl-L-alanine--D-glutamate ligase [Candidatus Parcubacteria bacterium]
MSFKGKRILIAGLGISNVEVVRYLAGRGLGSLVITDLKPEGQLRERGDEVRKVFPAAEFVLGRHREEDFLNADLIIRNPSVPLDAPPIRKAVAAGVPVETDISLFFKLCPSPNIIGVTGTKGKTTTATFLARMLEAQGFSVILAGNMGIPAFRELEKVRPDGWVVLELSSYMVESLVPHRVSPHIAVYTNIFPDHLDHYPTLAQYKNSKKALFKYQRANDLVLLNRESPALKEFVPEIKSRVVFYGADDVPEEVSLKLKGQHYRANLAAGFVLAGELGLDLVGVARTAEEFSGVEHRMEDLGWVGEIRFVNNSAATNPGAFLADLKTVVGEGPPIFLLAGGSDKNLDFAPMAEVINQTPTIEGVVLFAGAGTKRLVQLIEPEKVWGVFDNLPQAFEQIVARARRGGVVFLNPGCASFGVFEDEVDRGAQFKNQVEKLKCLL